VSLSDAELRSATTALDSFDGYVGVNNHMGSRFTAFKPGMETVLRLFKVRGLLFLDSRTTPQSVGDQVAQELGVPSVARHVFLDDDEALDAVRRRLAETEAVARRQGFVVAIGHPHEATLQALGEWLPGVAGKGFALAPLSAVLRKRKRLGLSRHQRKLRSARALSQAGDDRGAAARAHRGRRRCAARGRQRGRCRHRLRAGAGRGRSADVRHRGLRLVRHLHAGQEVPRLHRCATRRRRSPRGPTCGPT
jgi:hypothetical protein